jgi:hypothetical protein
VKDAIYRFIGMNDETRKQTVIALITAVIDCLTAFHIIEFTDAQIQAIYKLALCLVTAFVWGYCSHYRNNDFSEVASQHTAEMRQHKAELEDGYIGDRFFTDDSVEDEEVEDEQQDIPTV